MPAFRIKKFLRNTRNLLNQPKSWLLGKVSSTDYWTWKNVTAHTQFQTRQESLDFLEWRNGKYIDYAGLMPLAGHDGKVVLDYGCGPGHDLVGFAEYSRPAKVIGMEVSKTSLAEAKERLELHKPHNVDFVSISETEQRLPLDDRSVDYIHSSGVLHHIPEAGMENVIREFARILRPSGAARIMVYNRDSVWFHLFVAYIRRLVDGDDANVPIEDSFRKNTDGPNCPISRCYHPEEFIAIARKCGLIGSFLGAAIATDEMEILSSRFRAMDDRRLEREHRDFLLGLRFNDRGLPLHNGHVAGIDGVFEFRTAP